MATEGSVYVGVGLGVGFGESTVLLLLLLEYPQGLYGVTEGVGTVHENR